MIVCAHTDCGYSVGHTHRGGDNNKYIERPEGDFYVIKSNFTAGKAFRFHGDNNEMTVFACPKCRRLFIANGEVYEND